MKTASYSTRIGRLIQEARLHRDMTQTELAKELQTSQSAINRIEKGGQNISLEMLARISDVLETNIITLNRDGKTNLKIRGGNKLHGSIKVNTSKNAAVALLCASLLNKGKTTFRGVARIEEVNRIIEVLQSIGVKIRWINESDLEIVPPRKLDLANIDIKAAARTRSIIMFLGPLLHQYASFDLPFAGGCTLGTRTVEPHLSGLKHFGLDVVATDDQYESRVTDGVAPKRAIVLTERGDTVTENILMAAALHPGTTTIRNASPNYMVQDLCFFLQKLGVRVKGIGTTTLEVQGIVRIDQSVEYAPSEDPIEAMSLVAAAVVTDSELTVERVPMEFVEIEMAILAEMGLRYEATAEYPARNGHTRLADITIYPSKLTAAKDKLHALPFPGVNMDNLPFLALIAATAEGRTLVHDWSYENRAIYLTELTKLGAKVDLVDPHRVYMNGPTKWKPADVVAPPALRPSVVLLLAMLAAPGVSILRDTYSIDRGYENLASRLGDIGADIDALQEI